MNSSKLLKSQGWRGDGFSLDKDDKGLARPIGITRKADLSGAGTKQHDFTNQWWLKAWDKPTQSQVIALTAPVDKKHGLYAGFVKSYPLEGTVGFSDHSSGDIMGKSKHSTKELDAVQPPGEPALESVGHGSTSDPAIQPRKRKHDDQGGEAPLSTKKHSKKRKHTDEVGEAPVDEGQKSRKRRKSEQSEVGHAEPGSKEEARLAKKHRKHEHIDEPAANETAHKKKRHKSNEYSHSGGPDRMDADRVDSVVREDVEHNKDKSKKHKGSKKHKVAVEGPDKETATFVHRIKEAPATDDAFFVIDTVGDQSKAAKIQGNSEDPTRKSKSSSKSENTVFGHKAPLSNTSGNRQAYGTTPQLLGDDSTIEVAQASKSDGPHRANSSKPVSRDVSGVHKSRQALLTQTRPGKITAPPSHSDPNSFQTKKEKRRSPRIIRKEARAEKQAALIAEAREKGEPDPVFPKPLSKSEKRYQKRFKDPTVRKQKQIDRKLKRQEKSRAGVEERRRIEQEAQDAVDQMTAAGTMPDTSKPVNELIAEKRAELIAAAQAEGKLVHGAPKPKKPKSEPITEVNRDLDEDGKIRLRNLPPDQQELPEDFKVPSFKTVTMGIPIPNTKKRGSLKDLHRALVNASLTKAQISAYTVKAIREKKQQRLIKDQIRKQKREGRKRARAIKKQARKEGWKPPVEKKVKADKPENKAAEKREEEKKKKKERKERNLKINTGVILQRKMSEKRARGDNDPATKLEVKQSRREARKLVRMAKKGRLTAEEVPKDFRLKRSQKLKLQGNGGRIPNWTAPEISKNIASARRDAIAAADRENQPKVKT